MIYGIVFGSLGSALLILFSVVLIRAALFRPHKQNRTAAEKSEIDEKDVVERLRALVMCKTVSNADESKEDGREFDKLESLLPTLYPNVFAKTEFHKLGTRTLLFYWKGKDDNHSSASVCMAHYDVVAADPSAWEQDPFGGIEKDGFLWGRGTIDTKSTFNSTLYAANRLIGEGFVPEHDVYLAFAGDEEVSTGACQKSIAYLKERGVTPRFVIDEGGAVVDNVFPGVKKPCALIGTAEKGALSITYTLDGEGGHASAPKAHTSVGKLAAVVVEAEKRPFGFSLTAPVKEMFDTLGRESTFAYRVIFANLWLFRPLLSRMTKKKGGELNALVRTSLAFTMMKGSEATNVIPDHATIGANLRLLAGDDVASVKARLEKFAKDPHIAASYQYAWDASSVSRTDDYGYAIVKKAVQATWDDALVSPYLMVACADARFYSGYSDHVYRFSALRLSEGERNMIHGRNERLPYKSIAESAAFYYTLEKQL